MLIIYLTDTPIQFFFTVSHKLVKHVQNTELTEHRLPITNKMNHRRILPLPN